MTLEEMINEQQMLVNNARTQGRAMSEEETRRFDELQQQIDTQRTQSNNAAHAREGETQTQTGNGDGGDESGGDTQRAIAQERTRISNISAMCRDFEVDPTQYIQNGATEDQVRTAILEGLRRNSSPLTANATVTDDEGDKFRRAASDALMLRSGMTLENTEEGANELRGMSMKELAIECLQKDGQNATSLYRKGADEIYRMLQRGFYNPESAFPSILDQTIEKSYKEGHKNAPVTFDQFVKKGSLSDFKKHDNYYLAGPVGSFYEVPENGELKHDVFSDAKLPTRQLRTYGRQFTLSRKAFIDDDISLVTSIPARYAAAARKTQNKQVFEILLNNATIYDGFALFGKEHKNLVKAGTGATQAAVQTMIMALTNQKDEFGQECVINPGALVLPSGMAFDIYTLFESPTINTEDNTQAVNPLYQYRNQIKVIEDPTINALCGGLGKTMPWFMTGNPSDTDGIEIDYLNGQEIPNIRRMEAPGQLGFIWDIYLDWGITVMDYRGFVKNPGIKVDTKLELA